MSLCRKFSVITVLKSTADEIKENIQKYGFESRVSSVRCADVPVLELNDEEKAFRAILTEARKAIGTEGAEAIALGCTGMSPLARRLQKELDVPVIDPAVAALKLAEIFVSMGITCSRLAYEIPRDKKIL